MKAESYLGKSVIENNFQEEKSTDGWFFCEEEWAAADIRDQLMNFKYLVANFPSKSLGIFATWYFMQGMFSKCVPLFGKVVKCSSSSKRGVIILRTSLGSVLFYV